jgi:predicted PurR-regulated permease PerM
MLTVIGLIIAYTIPSLGTQISDIVSAVPKIVADIKEWIDNLFVKLSNLSLQNLDTLKSSFLTRIDTFSSDIQTSLPTTAMNIISSLVSGIGTIALSLIIGFYILYDFDKFTDWIIEILPVNVRGEATRLMGLLNESLYSFISGTLWLSLLLFVVSIIGFSIIGLNAPVLVSFVCVVTNLIPYIGPYLGAAVAGAIGFSQSSVIGILTLIFILIVQTIEGNVLQPLVMSKKMNLSPITIIISLLVFEYIFGVFGMVIATPVVALAKVIYVFFDQKYHFFGKSEN